MLEYRRDIDGLRALAVIAVVTFHALPTVMPGGFVGVDVFFVISGFLITGLLLDDLRTGSMQFAAFYARRARRIFPALVIVLLAVMGAGWLTLLADEFSSLGAQVAAAAAFSANIYFWYQVGYFDAAADAKPLLHLWSLGIEEQFYLFWPALVWLAIRQGWSLLRMTTAILIASFALNVASITVFPTSAFYLLPTRAWELAVGALLAIAAEHPRKLHPSEMTATALSVLGLGLVAIACIALDGRTRFPGWAALLPCLGATLLIGAGSGAAINRLVLANPMLGYIGRISYPLYLWHWPLLSFAHILSSEPLSITARLGAVALSVTLAAATYHFIERPIRSGFQQSPVVASGLATLTLVAICSIGVGIALSAGVPSRAANVHARMAADFAIADHGRSDGSCARLEIEPLTNAVCLANSASPRLLIVGDSHAMSLHSAIRVGQVPMDTLLMAGSGCLPFQGHLSRARDRPEEDRNCDRIADQALAVAQRLTSIRVVILVAMGPAYFTGTEADGRPNNYAIYRRGDLSEIDQEATFVDQFVGIAQKYAGLGKRVVFMIDVPELGFDPKRCVTRPVQFSSNVSCHLSRKAVEKRQTVYRDLVSRIQTQTPIEVYDPIPDLCDSRTCYWHDRDGAWYFDTHHLSVRGSRRILDRLLPFVERISKMR